MGPTTGRRGEREYKQSPTLSSINLRFTGYPPLSFLSIFFFVKDLLHRKSVRYTGLQNYEIVPLTNLP